MTPKAPASEAREDSGRPSAALTGAASLPVERFEHRPMDFIGVALPTIIYVGIASREKFDKIAAPLQDHGENENGHVLIKTVGNMREDEVTVIFQHWIKSLTSKAMLEDRAKTRASS